jgi:adenylate cyclase
MERTTTPSEALEELVLGAPRRYTMQDVLAEADIPDEQAHALWRSLGFTEVPEDEVMFTDRDLEAVELLSRLIDAGVLTPDVCHAVARAVAQSMSRLAEWQVGTIRQLIAGEGADPGAESGLRIAGAVLPAMEQLQTYVWRRHLAATVSRTLAITGEPTDGTVPLVVGFADMVGFTSATRRRSTEELAEMIERFGSSTADVIADGGGRIIKTVGDEVLFVADDIADGAVIALALQERVRIEPALPELRIGLAAGPVLQRYGDVYGEVVNIAARLTSHARPDSVLVDRTVADALSGDARFAVRPLRSVAVRGYRHLHPWLLEPAAG